MTPKLIIASLRTAVAFLVGYPLCAASSPCALDKLLGRLEKPSPTLSIKEIAVAEGGSTEGGKWQLGIDPSGKLQRAIRTDFGETGQRQITLSFLDERNYVIRQTQLQYKEPISPGRPAIVQTRTVVDFFYCGDWTYVPVYGTDSSAGAAAIVEAARLRDRVLSAKELAPYLNRSR